jgi:hypothetical protein
MSAACSSCGADIVWARTLNGKAMPLDAQPNAAGAVLLYSDGTCRVLKSPERLTGDHAEHRHDSHFSTCPNAAQHRRRSAS